MKGSINQNIPDHTTLDELLAILGPVTRADKSPSAKKLWQEAGNPVVTGERCRVYANGYAVYHNDVGQTVLWVPDCRQFTYCFNRMRSGERNDVIKESFTLPDGILKSLPWSIAVTLTGEHRIEKLAMRRKGDRKGNKSLIRGDNEEGEAVEELEERENSLEKEYFWREDQMGEDPERIYIRRETRQRALASMTEKQRQAFCLYYRDGYTQREIAEQLNLARTSVMHRLEEALKKIQKFYC
ncbi:MAG: sigma-70 family RNA polymerase sigma factor [Prevotellaceae bacterium]|nr:sigma-70 family RNA polymerase sigma factor [Prevotellaceae bacterium]